MNHRSILSLIFALLLGLLVCTPDAAAFQNPQNMQIQKSDFSYEQAWENVSRLEKKGLPQSALKVVEEILKNALREQQLAHEVAARIYRIKYNYEFSRGDFWTAMHREEAAVSGVAEPGKQMLHSVLGDLYERDLNHNKWVIMERQPLANDTNANVEQWDYNRYLKEIRMHYKQSLQNPSLLQKTPARAFVRLLNKAPESLKFRPTLYDFLAHRLIQMYLSNDPFATMPAVQFELTDAVVFDLPKSFVNTSFKVFNTPDHVREALSVFQELERFHMDDQVLDPLADAVKKRLAFGRKYFRGDNKEELYLNGCRKMQNYFKGHSASAEFYFLEARLLYDQSKTYQNSKEEVYRWKAKEALEICHMVQEQWPESDGGNDCQALLKEILESELSLQSEDFILPQQPALLLLGHRNVDTAYFRIVRMDPEQVRNIQRNKQDWISHYLKQQPERFWALVTRMGADYQLHTAEVKLPPLESGYYLVMVSNKSNPADAYDLVAYKKVWVSRLSLIYQRDTDETIQVYVQDRETGEAVKGATIQAFSYKYENKSRREVFVSGPGVTTDRMGMGLFKLAAGDPYSRNYYFDVQKGEDRIISPRSIFFGTRSQRQAKTRYRTFFFADRAIYRPGQTIYFKGLVVETRPDKTHLPAKDIRRKVVLRDVNYQEMASLELVSNDYGSFSGQFVLPQNVLSGDFTLSTEKGDLRFRVEAYKRPKFEVQFLPLEGEYALNQMVEVVGEAKAYAGYPLNDANVKYRVVRKTIFPYRSWWSFLFDFAGPPDTEIANGHLSTNQEGRYTIAFKALPDLSVQKKYHPVFAYQIIVDVTDINGETHSATTQVQVGYESLLLDLDLPEHYQLDFLPPIKLGAVNLNQEPVDATIQVKVSQLKDPATIMKSRYWQQPDYSLMEANDFKRDFPHDPYQEQMDYRKWEVEKEMSTLEFDTRRDSLLLFKGMKEWAAGVYRFELETTDENGNVVKLERHATLFSAAGSNVPANQLFWYVPLQTKVRAGASARILVGSAYKKARLLLQTFRNGKTDQIQWISLNGRQRVIEIPVPLEENQKMGYNLSMVALNRSMAKSEKLVVDQPEKRLEVAFTSFRELLRPGGSETWRLRLKRASGEGMEAELLAGMYDASLDAFVPHAWHLELGKDYWQLPSWHAKRFFTAGYGSRTQARWRIPKYSTREYDEISLPIPSVWGRDVLYSISRTNGYPAARMATKSMDMEDEMLEGEALPAGQEEDSPAAEEGLRTRLQETAFFYPQLLTNPEGEVEIRFTVPEALTRWKLMGLAHTKDLAFTLFDKELVTRKELMVTPNLPRFFREGDVIRLQAKIANLAERHLEGKARIELLDAETLQPVSGLGELYKAAASFVAETGESTVVEWEFQVPTGHDAFVIRMTAQAGKFTDGEEVMVPVISNRRLVTESLPLAMSGKGEKQYSMKGLLQSGNTRKNHRLTLEVSSNPAWYAVTALPYLMENNFKSSNAIFQRYYANALGVWIANSDPRFGQLFKLWKSQDAEVLKSSLERNQELKDLLLEVTPWLGEAKDETSRKQEMGAFFDQNKMQYEMRLSLKKLQAQQLSNGGWAWFPGMKDNPYTTLQIATGLARLRHLGVLDWQKDATVKRMLEKAIRYLDDRVLEDYHELLTKKPEVLKHYRPGGQKLYYLYTRSFFMDEWAPNKELRKAISFYHEKANVHWLKNGLYLQGLHALASYRLGQAEVAQNILASLRERARVSDELGRYWASNVSGYHWHEAPIATQALLIEAFEEIEGAGEEVRQMKLWLLKNKQTNRWHNARATVDAVYAFLLRGDSPLAMGQPVSVQLGSTIVNPASDNEIKTEAGTGYYKLAWEADQIEPDMGKITIQNPNEQPSWGAVYYQYFEQLENIESHQSPLQVDKQLYVERLTDHGPELLEIRPDTKIHVGDKIISRVIIQSDRSMEFVHLQDMRASGLEPVETLSGYRWRMGPGGYLEIKDASINLFFDYLPKGTHVVELASYAVQQGDFSNGITTIQSYYAPEFAAHSKGVRIQIGE